MTTLTLSKDAINRAIMFFEIGWTPETGYATYNRLYAKPVVPDPKNTDSGVTIGNGYDCGQYSAAKIKTDWSSVLPANMVNLLAKTAGLKKQAAVNAMIALELKKYVLVPIEAALQVFFNNTIYSFAKQALKIYPDLPKLHPVEQAVIIGIVYNRGAGLGGDRRREMRQLIQAIKNDNDKEMSDLILAMCRLWPNTLGLQKRRKAEAALIMLPDNPIPETDKLILTI